MLIWFCWNIYLTQIFRINQNILHPVSIWLWSLCSVTSKDNRKDQHLNATMDGILRLYKLKMMIEADCLVKSDQLCTKMKLLHQPKRIPMPMQKFGLFSKFLLSELRLTYFCERIEWQMIVRIEMKEWLEMTWSSEWKCAKDPKISR